jgi:hypothetical protein
VGGKKIERSELFGVAHIRERRDGVRTELIIRAQHAVKFSTISQDDEHLSWGRIKKEKEKRVARGAGARADVLSTQSTREPDVVNGMRESMRSGS